MPVDARQAGAAGAIGRTGPAVLREVVADAVSADCTVAVHLADAWEIQ